MATAQRGGAAQPFSSLREAPQTSALSVEAASRSIANYLIGYGDWIDYYAGWIDKNTGQTIPAVSAFSTRPEPIGVAVILTWNSSSAAFDASVGGAGQGCGGRQAGRAAPFSGSLFGRLCLDAGLPARWSASCPAGLMPVKRWCAIPTSLRSVSPVASRLRGHPGNGGESLTPLLFELGGKSANSSSQTLIRCRLIGRRQRARGTERADVHCSYPPARRAAVLCGGR
jgi:hypothetical protein